MCTKCLGFVLLIWFAGMLHAQSAAQSCNAPRLDGGFFAPNQETYPNGTTLTYLCDKGHKPAVGGWSATSTCQNGSWTHEPQCIDVTACFPPEIANGNYAESSNGWYEDRHKLRIKCDEGYEHKKNVATTTCADGQWSSLPVCQKSEDSCDAPQIPHAVIIGEGYKEVFAADSSVQYECEDGYTVEEKKEKKLICIAGTWSDGPTCSKRPEPGTAQGGSAEVRPSDGHTTSTGHETQPAEIGCVMPANRYVGQGYVTILFQDVILKEGERRLIDCIWPNFQSLVRCSNGRMIPSRCCHRNDRNRGLC